MGDAAVMNGFDVQVVKGVCKFTHLIHIAASPTQHGQRFVHPANQCFACSAGEELHLYLQITHI